MAATARGAHLPGDLGGGRRHRGECRGSESDPAGGRRGAAWQATHQSSADKFLHGKLPKQAAEETNGPTARQGDDDHHKDRERERDDAEGQADAPPAGQGQKGRKDYVYVCSTFKHM